MIPGLAMPPGLLAGGASGLTNVTAITHSTTTTQYLTLPTDILPGDLLVVFNSSGYVYGWSQPTITNRVPVGFTQIDTREGSWTTQENLGDGTYRTRYHKIRYTASYRLADGTESGSSRTVMADGTSCRAMCTVFRGNRPIQNVILGAVTGNAMSGDQSARTISSGNGLPPVLVVAFMGAHGSVGSTRTFTPAPDGEVSPASSMYMLYKCFPPGSQPTNVTIDTAVFINTMNYLGGTYFNLA